MHHDIEADYKEACQNEEKQCRHCDSFQNGYCKELEQKVLPVGHCDFFRSA